MSMKISKSVIIQSFRPGLILGTILAVCLILGMAVSSAAAKEAPGTLQGQHVLFAASGTGTFLSEGSVNDNHFTTSIWGTGSSDDFGEFTYAFLILEDSSNLPAGCDTGIGTTSLSGSGVMIFAAGVLFVEQISGEACVDISTYPPIIEIAERYKITGGTGIFDHAKGKLTLESTADFIKFTVDATFNGKIKID